MVQDLEFALHDLYERHVEHAAAEVVDDPLAVLQIQVLFLVRVDKAGGDWFSRFGTSPAVRYGHSVVLMNRSVGR